MFKHKFENIRENRLITEVKINGPFITFYVDEENLNKFQSSYASKILKHNGSITSF
jgi:hypothetical protein